MEEFDLRVHPHRRYNPLLNEYILVSPHRMKRPWLGQVELPQDVNLPPFDEHCYLCPGNVRSSGQRNEQYETTYVFHNDFAAILPPPSPAPPLPVHHLLNAEPVHGGCDVIVFHPRHDLSLSRLSIDEIKAVIQEWINIYRKRGCQEGIKYVQIFENKGLLMGCSNPHPHGQVWSLSAIPTLPLKELVSFQQYSHKAASFPHAPRGPNGRPCLLCEYAHLETSVPESESRVVSKDENWLALVPWWATWPYEVLLLPHQRHIPSIDQMTDHERTSFATMLSRVTKKYDNLFQCSFAYSLGIHQRPTPTSGEISLPSDQDEDNLMHLHLHFTPPLLRSASIRKFLVGFELMAEAQRDLTPEDAAARLRNCSEIHFIDDIDKH